MELKTRYAGVAPRFPALCLDLAVFCALFFPITKLVKGVWLMMPDGPPRDLIARSRAHSRGLAPLPWDR